MHFSLFRDIGETIFDGLVGLKRAVGLNDLADRLEREKERRNKRRNKGKSGKGKRSVPDAVVDEYARRVAEALEAAAIADYGDCAKKSV